MYSIVVAIFQQNIVIKRRRRKYFVEAIIYPLIINCLSRERSLNYVVKILIFVYIRIE